MHLRPGLRLVWYLIPQWKQELCWMLFHLSPSMPVGIIKLFVWLLGYNWVLLSAFHTGVIIVVVKWTALGHMVLAVGHLAINDNIYLSRHWANVSSHSKTSGVNWSDGRQPDRISIILWESGNWLLWAATTMDTFAPSHHFVAFMQRSWRSCTTGWIFKALKENIIEKQISLCGSSGRNTWCVWPRGSQICPWIRALHGSSGVKVQLLSSSSFREFPWKGREVMQYQCWGSWKRSCTFGMFTDCLLCPVVFVNF